MSSLNIPEEILSAIGFSLLHSIWQAALIALFVFVLLRLLKNATAMSRYFVAFTALTMMVLLPILTFYRSYEPSILSENAISELSTAASLPSVIYVLADSQFGLDELIANLDSFLLLAAPKVFWFWLLGMLIMSIRLSGGYFVAYRLKNKGVKNVSNDWQERLNQLAVQMKIKRKIRFLESARIDVPMVIGYLKPVLIVPLGTLARIPFDELEMILAHELAHIKRADFLVNILQSIVETLLFFNPFVWYLSAIIRQERENICDDIALQTTGHKLSLAKALVSISSNPKETIQYNSILYFNKFNTMKRIERLFNNPRLKPSPTEKMTVTVLSLVFVLFISTSGVLTGSNVADNLNDVVSNIWKSNSEIATDTIVKNTGTPEKKTKEVEVEVVNGKTVKMIVDGVEIPAEELENEEYTWVDNDTTLTKKITIRNGEGKHKTMVIKSDAVKVHQRDDGSSEYEFVTNGAGPEKEVHIIKKVGKGEGAKTEAFIWTSDNDSNNASSGNGNKKKVYFISNDGDKMEMDEQMIWVEAEALGKEAERINLEMKHLDPNNQEDMDRLAAELEALEAENIAMEHEFNFDAPAQFDGEHEFEIFIDDHNQFEFKNENSVDYQYFKLLKQEMLQDGIGSKRSNVILSRKQLIVDNNVLDKKTHKHFLSRYEAIFGKKLEADEAINLKL